MEAAIRWSPHSTNDRSRFMVVDVASNRLKLCQVDSLRKKDGLKYREITQRDKLPNFTAFDWSKSRDYLVAIGLASGEAALIWIDGDRSHSGIIHSFPIRNQRKCNTISFSTHNLLATGLDRVRNDFSMNIYDLNSGSWTTQQEPYRKLSSSEAITSVKFLSSQPDTLLAGVSRQGVRIYDLRDHTGMGAAQFSTRHVHNIAIDPLDENYFITAGPNNEPSVSLWDRRFAPRANSTIPSEGSLSGAVLELKPAVESPTSATIWSLRYSGIKRGCFGILSSTGEVRVVELAQHSMKQSHQPTPLNSYGGIPWNSRHYTRMTHTLRPPWHQRHGVEDASRVISVDFVGKSLSPSPCMLSLLLDHSVDILPVPDSPPHARISALDEIAFPDGKPLKPRQAPSRRSVAEDLSDLQRQMAQARLDPLPYSSHSLKSSGRSIDDGTSNASSAGHTSREAHEELLGVPFHASSLHHSDDLRIIPIQRRRCQEGYLFNCTKNQRIVANDPWLVEMWDVVKRLEDLSKDHGMVSEGLDLSYLGVRALWENDPVSDRTANRFLITGSFSQKIMIDGVIRIARNKGYPAFDGVKTKFPEHRQLCLALCGWNFSKEEVRQRCHDFMGQQEYYKSIVVAVFHGRRDIALELLKECIQQKRIENIGLGAVIACETVNREQRELCEWMAEESTDVYLKALLGYFVSGDWNSVLEMEQLSIPDRIGVALRHLDDDSLTRFLKATTMKAIAEGDIEGIVLTGLSEQAMDLFQSYIAKFNDLQTAVLAMGFSNPLYVADSRWEIWKEAYFMQMQAWRAFTERTRFILHHNRKSITRDGHQLNDTPPRQLTLRCNHCLGSLARREKKSTPLQNGNSKPSIDVRPTRSAGGSAGIVCPRCGRHMPRCGICMMWLGTPDPSKPSGAAAMANEDLMAKFITFCMTCNHGFHAHHAKDWFVKHQMCPVPDCQCLCGLKH